MYVNENYAAVIVGDGQVSVMRSGGIDEEGRTTYTYLIRHAQGHHTGADLHTGAGIDHGPAAMLGSLLSFLGAAAESYAHQMRTKEPGENSAMFPAEVNAWAYMWGDELSMLQLEIEQEGQCTCNDPEKAGGNKADGSHWVACPVHDLEEAQS